MLKPLSCVQASSSICAMQVNAAQAVMLCMKMKWLSTLGSGDISTWKVVGIGRLNVLRSINAALEDWHSDLELSTSVSAGLASI